MNDENFACKYLPKEKYLVDELSGYGLDTKANVYQCVILFMTWYLQGNSISEKITTKLFL